MDLPSLVKIKPLLAIVYLQLTCSGTDHNSSFKSLLVLFSNPFNKATVRLWFLISHKSSSPLEAVALKLFLSLVHAPSLAAQHWISDPLCSSLPLPSTRARSQHCCSCPVPALWYHAALKRLCWVPETTAGTEKLRWKGRSEADLFSKLTALLLFLFPLHEKRESLKETKKQGTAHTEQTPSDGGAQEHQDDMMPCAAGTC